MKKTFLLLSLLYITLNVNIYANAISPVQKVLVKEKSQTHRNNIQAIINKYTERYDNLYDKLKKGGKITVFIDPAHGKLSSRSWQGDVTWRQSTTDKPEEYYSIPLSRNLYHYLRNNRYIRVATTNSYLKMLRGESDEYYDISFSKTTSLADKADSFIIVSSHLNNIDPIHKAEGLVNLYGIHVTMDRYGNRYISHVKNVSRGFLTLYNAFDGSGFSREYAENLKSELLAIDMYANGWGKGVVSDSRFSYFYNYPLSVIYETAFISNPVEEKFLRIEKNQRLIAKAQYESLINTISSQFGVDISGTVVKKRFDQPKKLTELIILSQIAVYYIKHKKIDEASYTSKLIAENANNSYVKQYYTQMATKLDKSIAFQKKAEANKKNKKEYASNMLKAARALNGENILDSLRTQIYAKRRSVTGYGVASSSPPAEKKSGKKLGGPPKHKPLSVNYEEHTYKTPVILTIKPGQSLNDAIAQSIAPNVDIEEKVQTAMYDVRVTKVKWVRKYSTRRQKYYWKKEQYFIKKQFEPGIYIVLFNKNLTIKSVQSVDRVEFDPKKYQNQEYFKNSSFASNARDKSL
jgi:N-acetylmuramoyl-L-alanine amidase